MNYTNAPAERYTHARIHIIPGASMKSRTRSLLISLDTRPLGTMYKDGDHFFARIIDYEIHENGKVKIVLGPLWRVQSNDGPSKWHLAGWKTERWESTFEDCERLGGTNKSRARFRIPGELLLILSRSKHDRTLIEELVSES